MSIGIRLIVVLVLACHALPAFAQGKGKKENPKAEQPAEVPAESSDAGPRKTTPKPPKPELEAESSGTKPKDSTLSTSSFAMMSSGSGEGARQFPQLNSASVQVEPFTGSASVPITLEVPPGRAGLQPNLTLAYSSTQQSGMFGVGWSLDLGSIQRSLKNGVPKYTTADTYAMGGQELIDVGDGTFKPEIEGGFQKIERVGDYWRVTDTKGTKFTFGQTLASRQTDPSNTSKIFKWCLDYVEDINGNTMTITYTKQSGQIYPQKIEYTGHTGGLQPFARVEFVYTTAPKPSTSYRQGFLVKNDLLVDEIKTYAADQLQGSYKLTYSASISSMRSLLTSVQQFGADGGSLPPISFSYQGAEKGYVEVSSAGIPADLQFSYPYNDRWYDRGVRVVDVNADGYPDMMRKFPDCNNSELTYNATYLNDKSNNWVQSGQWVEDWTPGFVRACNESFDRDMGIRFADANGDGWTDVFQSLKMAPGVVQRTPMMNNQINDFTYQGNWNINGEINFIDVLGGQHEFMGTLFDDVNADGHVDLVQSKQDNGGLHAVYKHRYPADGWQLDSSWSVPATAQTDLSRGATLVDLNGDGLSDIYHLQSGTATVYMNTGSGWVLDALSPYINTFGVGNLMDGSTQFGDLNGDGLADLIVAVYGSGKYALINTGYGWFMDDYWRFYSSLAAFERLSTRLLDADADGMLDHVIFESHFKALFLNKGQPADLLKSIDNGLGALTTIAYEPSTKFTNTFMPFPIQVVKSLTVEDGWGSSFTTTYEYTNGKWQPYDREFLGFEKVKIKDPDGNYTETTYLQDHFKKGRIAEQAVYSSSGQLFAKTVNTWTERVVVPGSKLVYLTEVNSYTYDGEAVPRRTKQQMLYDDPVHWGLVTGSVAFGEVDAVTGADLSPMDNVATYTQYVHNTASNIVGLPHTTYVEAYIDNGMGQLVLTTARKSTFYYDGNSSLTSPPVKGRLTKKVDWLDLVDQTKNPVTQYAYDAYGNLTSTTDPLNRVTTIAYDTAYRLFPLTTTNALTHAVTTEYYGVNGVALSDAEGYRGLWGQVKSTTDPNNKIAKRRYDEFGRMTDSVGPLDTLAYPTVHVDYAVGANYLKVKTQQRIKHGEAGTIDSSAFHDGFGRLIQTKTPSGQANRWIVSGQTTYNVRGLPEKKFLSRFTTNNLDTIDAIDLQQPHAVLTYDAVGRLLDTANPDGSVSGVRYGPWVVSSFDENGHKQVSYFDAFGRLNKKEEYTGADGRSSHYPLQPYSLYATTHYTYDGLGNLVKTRDAQDNEVVISYDRLGRKTGMNDPDMGIWSYTYDKAGNLIEQTDAKGQKIFFSYDALNRLTRKYNNGTLDVNYTFDDATAENSKGRLTRAAYANEDTQFKYDALGREIESIKEINGTLFNVKRAYDALNQMSHLEYPDQSKVFYKYNDAGQITAVANDAGLLDNPAPTETADFLTFTEADPTNRITVTSSCISSNNIETQNANAYVMKDYTSFANFTHTFRAKIGSSGTWAGDLVVWGVSDTANQTFNLWNNGIYLGFTRTTESGVRLNLRQRSGAVVTTFESSPSALPINTYFYFKVVRNDTSVVVYMYSDAAMTNLVDTFSGTTTFSANLRYLYAFSTQDLNIGYKKMYSTVCDMKTSPTAASNPVIFVKSVEYNPNGQMTRLEYGNGVVTTYTYHASNFRLTRMLTVDKNNVSLQDFTYTYDSAGNILSITDAVHTADQTFRYDALNRLTQAIGQNYATRNYVYDTIGNIIQKDGLTYTYGAGTAGPHAVTGLSDGTTMTYDANGNMVTMTKGSVAWEYIYDVENRLIEVKKNLTTLTTYIYDGDGGRTQKTVYGSTTTNTAYVGEFYEITNGLETHHVYFQGQKMASYTNNTATGVKTLAYSHSDHLGGANIVTNLDGTLKELVEYLPFGALSRHDKYGNSEEVAWFYFSGKKLEGETGLNYFGARYCNPSLGRFITADRIVPYPSNPQAFNRYTYAGNNPISYLENGNAWFIPFIIAAIKGAAIGATVGAATSAITGGDIGKGALFGAIGGGVFGGLSSGFTSLAKYAMLGTTNASLIGGASTTVNILGATVAGAGAGAAGAAFLGADPLNGAGIGALSGGLFRGIGGLKGTGWAGVGRVALAGAAGGVVSEVAGGSFIDGFVFASSIASADFIYRAILNSQGYDRGATMKTATKNGEPKFKIDKDGNVIISEKSLHQDLNISHSGFAVKSPNAPDDLWKHFFGDETGPVMSFLGNNAPGIQGMSLVHDITGDFLSGAMGETANAVFFNFQTMPPIYGLNLVGSMINDSPALMGVYQTNQREF